VRVRGANAGGAENFFDLDAIKSYTRVVTDRDEVSALITTPGGTTAFFNRRTLTLTNPSTCRDMAVTYVCHGRSSYIENRGGVPVTAPLIFTVFDIDGVTYGGPVTLVAASLYNTGITGDNTTAAQFTTSPFTFSKNIAPGATTTFHIDTHYGMNFGAQPPSAWYMEEMASSIHGSSA
jgi:hypothetical protein